MIKKRVCILATVLLILTILSSCSTAPVKTEVVDPALTFPAFPDPFDENGNAIPQLDKGKVTVPQWYWTKITEYVVDVEKVREMYDAWRKIYLAEEK